jgi:hypothetical protein
MWSHPTPLLSRPRGERVNPRVVLGPDKSFANLLFVTDENALARRIGAPALEAARGYVVRCGGDWLSGAGPSLLGLVRGRLERADLPRGVVLLGGYEVVPSRTLDVLPPDMRGLEMRDSDRMRVWSDDDYGDREGDGVPEVPVSRVPDLANGALFVRALAAPLPAAVASRAGIRNRNREFADSVYAMLPGREVLRVCEPSRPALDFRNDVLYFMLHGSWRDTSRFKGESPDDVDPYPEALTAADIPDPCPPLVFAGCCYGALTVSKRAREMSIQDPVQTVPVESSIALSCLARGANAFIGCTGVHYSPMLPNFQYLGEPLHRFFFEEVLAGKAPARALLDAKVRYASRLPFRGRRASAVEVAAENKILRQFTCLGVGW